MQQQIFIQTNSPDRKDSAPFSWSDFFSFRRMITLQVMQVIYFVVAGLITVAAIITIFFGKDFPGFMNGGFLMGISILVLGNILWRICCELVTIGIMMKTANGNDKLDDYINNFVSKYPDKTQIHFSGKYNNMVAYEIKDKSMYQDIGGGHLYMIGIERAYPKYPGLLLEDPISLPDGNTGEVNYYNASGSKDRFKGKIFYAIMLDTSGDIYDKSFAIFKSLFDKQIIIE